MEAAAKSHLVWRKFGMQFSKVPNAKRGKGNWLLAWLGSLDIWHLYYFAYFLLPPLSPAVTTAAARKTFSDVSFILSLFSSKFQSHFYRHLHVRIRHKSYG
jgi:hypothetical protein